MTSGEEGGPFLIGVTLVTLQQTGNPPKRRSRRNATRGQTISSPLQKKNIYINGSVPPLESGANRSRLTSCDLQAKVVRLGDRWQVDGRSIGSLDCFPSEWADSTSAFSADSQTRPSGRDGCKLEPNTADFRVDPTYGNTGRSPEHPSF